MKIIGNNNIITKFFLKRFPIFYQENSRASGLTSLMSKKNHQSLSRNYSTGQSDDMWKNRKELFCKLKTESPYFNFMWIMETWKEDNLLENHATIVEYNKQAEIPENKAKNFSMFAEQMHIVKSLFQDFSKVSPEYLEKLKRIDINGQDEETKMTMLHLAIFYQVPIWIKTLLKNGAKSDIRDVYGCVAADYCPNPSEQIATIFDEYNVRNSKVLNELELKKKARTKLLVGSIMFNREVTFDQLLVHPDLDVNLKQSYIKDLDLTPLHFAVCYGRLHMVKSLLKHPQIDPEITDSIERTALDLAVGKKMEDIVKVLEEDQENRSKLKFPLANYSEISPNQTPKVRKKVNYTCSFTSP